jgi:hypothetical protein
MVVLIMVLVVDSQVGGGVGTGGANQKKWLLYRTSL